MRAIVAITQHTHIISSTVAESKEKLLTPANSGKKKAEKLYEIPYNITWRKPPAPPVELPEYREVQNRKKKVSQSGQQKNQKEKGKEICGSQ